MAKYDPALGLKVHKHLVNLGLEHPHTSWPHKDQYAQGDMHADTARKLVIEHHMTEICKIMGMDLNNDSTRDTPKRIAKMYVEETMCGLDYTKFPALMTFENAFRNSGMVIERGIKINSMCSHHLVPTIGIAHVGYVPDQKVAGLSKLNRICEFFSRRPQEQERLCMQIQATLAYLLETDNVAVYIDATHYCVKWRGVETDGASMITAKLGGGFMDDPALRSEFYHAIAQHKNGH